MKLVLAARRDAVAKRESVRDFVERGRAVAEADLRAHRLRVGAPLHDDGRRRVARKRKMKVLHRRRRAHLGVVVKRCRRLARSDLTDRVRAAVTRVRKYDGARLDRRVPLTTAVDLGVGGVATAVLAHGNARVIAARGAAVT